MSEQDYLLYVWAPSGYSIEACTGGVPTPGSELNINGIQLLVSKIAASPLPDDQRPCAYLQPA
ncbi:MAG: hypothetical protein ABSC51_07475 [Gaiellaceae bacterium]